MKLKVAKPCYRYDWCVGNKANCNSKLKSLAQDSMHKPYVRSARNANNLPNSWDSTKLIKRQKSWKHRCKKKKQWMKHIMSAYEKYICGLISVEEYCE